MLGYGKRVRFALRSPFSPAQCAQRLREIADTSGIFGRNKAERQKTLHGSVTERNVRLQQRSWRNPIGELKAALDGTAEGSELSGDYGLPAAHSVAQILWFGLVGFAAVRASGELAASLILRRVPFRWDQMTWPLILALVGLLGYAVFFVMNRIACREGRAILDSVRKALKAD